VKNPDCTPLSSWICTRSGLKSSAEMVMPPRLLSPVAPAPPSATVHSSALVPPLNSAVGATIRASPTVTSMPSRLS
jgi:hypothetical protein